MTFQELGIRMDVAQVGMEEICRRTESGTICTACLPDLLQFIAARAR
jgi:hypothetical protein